MYQTEIEAKKKCISNKNCLGIQLWDHSTTGKTHSLCMFPNRLIPKNQDTREPDKGIIVQGRDIFEEEFRGIIRKKIHYGRLYLSF